LLQSPENFVAEDIAVFALNLTIIKRNVMYINLTLINFDMFNIYICSGDIQRLNNTG